MANLSKLKRDRMLGFLDKIRENHKDDDDVLVSINEIENEILSKKYGLVWERHSEEVEERMVEEVPVFAEIQEKELTLTDGGYNFLLEGDNLHSLYLLEKTHKEKVDVIYIDPPYNTGNKDFIYDDYMVGKEDSFRHSMWLSFMERRLRVAKNLLSKTGVIFISIDDNEQSALKMLCDDIFGSNNFVSCFIWEKKRVVQNDAKFSSINHEYVLAYRKSDALMGFNLLPRTAEMNARYDNPDNDPRGAWTSVALTAKSGSASNIYDMTFPNGVYWKPTPGTYPRLSKDSLIRAYDEGRLWFGKNGKNVPRLKKYLSEVKQGIITNSILSNDVAGSTQLAKEQLKRTINQNIFDTPKPIPLIQLLLKIGADKSALVLDFFAGSGTTGQAVLELNKEDGGNRKFILCTNNENNICESVTYPRLQTAITGIRQDGNKYSEGIPANLKYYRTDFVKKNTDTLTEDLLNHIDEMIQLEYHVKIDKEKYVSVLSDEEADELEKDWSKYPDIRAIYISRNVLLTAAQRDLFESKECFVIPDYYFRNELKEAGEA